MAYVPPTVAEFKARFDRDFAYAAEQTDLARVRDVDITRAFTQATANFNESLWPSQDIYAEAFLLLSAHHLVTTLTASSMGLGGSSQWLTNSKAVGNVQESFTIPERILRSPWLGMISKTLYGAQYLTMVAPRLLGNVACVDGATTP